MKTAHSGGNLSDAEMQTNIDLIMREIERSDNEALRSKKDVMKAFIQTKFYDLPEDADIQKAYEEFEKEYLYSEIESFSFSIGLDKNIIVEIFTEYSFGSGISDEAIRKRLEAYHFGLLKMTKLTNDIKGFVTDTYNKFKAEGE